VCSYAYLLKNLFFCRTTLIFSEQVKFFKESITHHYIFNVVVIKYLSIKISFLEVNKNIYIFIKKMLLTTLKCFYSISILSHPD